MNNIDLGKLKFTWKGPYLAASTYEKDDCVEYDGTTFVHVGATPTTGIAPTAGGNATWQVMAKGQLSGKSVFAGGPSNHEHHVGSDWAAMPTMDLSSHTIAPNPEYVSVSGGIITIEKAGYYHIHGYIMQHCEVQSTRDLVVIWGDGNPIQRSYLVSPPGWDTAQPSVSGYLTEGQTISVRVGVHADSNSYSAHSHSYHTVIFLDFLGD